MSSRPLVETRARRDGYGIGVGSSRLSDCLYDCFNGCRLGLRAIAPPLPAPRLHNADAAARICVRTDVTTPATDATLTDRRSRPLPSACRFSTFTGKVRRNGTRIGQKERLEIPSLENVPQCDVGKASLRDLPCCTPAPTPAASRDRALTSRARPTPPPPPDASSFRLASSRARRLHKNTLTRARAQHTCMKTRRALALSHRHSHFVFHSTSCPSCQNLKRVF